MDAGATGRRAKSQQRGRTLGPAFCFSICCRRGGDGSGVRARHFLVRMALRRRKESWAAALERVRWVPRPYGGSMKQSVFGRVSAGLGVLLFLLRFEGLSQVGSRPFIHE